MKTIKIILLTLMCSGIYTITQAQDLTASGAVNNVITTYYNVKNTLTADNLEGANTSAKELLAAINAVPADKLTADQKKVWAAYADKLQFDARHMSEAPNIDHEREHFTNLSKNMITVVNAMKLNTATVYQQYCPMKKVSWLSESASIKNPFYGKQMLTCGKVTETLAPAVK